jgi:hypothetical protein
MIRNGAALACLNLLIVCCSCQSESQDSAAQSSADFGNPQRVEILGYNGDAMEPFIACDGRYLFFNNRNEPSAQTDVLYAEKDKDESFRFLGPVPGLNQPAPVLDAVPSMDAAGQIFFISTRSYESSLSTLFSGDFRDGRAWSVSLVAGNFSRRQPGWLTMDAEVSRDGGLLYFTDSRFAGGAIPEEADLGVARRSGGTFDVVSDSRAQLANVNSKSLEYAPSTSADGLELFFTRLKGSLPVILHSTRAGASLPFDAPRSLSAISGFAEAPSLSCDGRTLYYHRKDGDQYSIYRVTRTP